MNNLIINLLDIYLIIIIARVVISWLNIDHSNQIVQMIYKMTEPVLKPVRKVIPILGGFDLSPIVVFFGINFLKSVLF